MTDETPDLATGSFASAHDGANGDRPGGDTSATEPEESVPQPGELHIHQKRSWRSWQLAAAVLVALIVGMWINGDTGGGSASAGSGTPAGESKLPPAQGPSAGSGSPTTAPRGSSVTTTTVAGGAGSATTTTVPGGTGAGSGTTGTTQPLGQESYLVPAYQSTGNWTSPAFNIAGSTWYLGWAFACNPVPAAKPTFAVYVVPSGGSPSGTPAVTSSDPQGQSVTNLTSTGSQSIAVQAPPQCRWVVKVTGYGG